MSNFINSINVGGLETKLIACLTKSGAPSSTTEGDVGVLLMDTDTGDLYKCTGASSGVYTWVKISEGTGGGSSVEIVDGTGDRMDAVMSQKASTDAFVPIVPYNLNGAYGAYVTDGNGFSLRKLSWVGTHSDSIAVRGVNGVLQVGAPTAANHATTKTYVDAATSIRYCPTSSTDDGVQVYSVSLVGVVGGNANYTLYRRCIIPCNGYACSPGVDISLSNASISSGSDCKIFRWDNLTSQEVSITYTTPNTISVRPSYYCPTNFMLVLDIYYYFDGAYKMLYISASGGKM